MILVFHWGSFVVVVWGFFYCCVLVIWCFFGFSFGWLVFVWLFFCVCLVVLCLPRKGPRAFTLSFNKVILSEAFILL